MELFECPICCEENALVVKAPCGHEFCATCIQRTFCEVNKKCPFCRAMLPIQIDKYVFTTRLNFENLNAQQIQNIFPFVCRGGNLVDVTQCVEQFGIDVNQPDSVFGLTPLFMSSENGHFPIVKFLVQNDAAVNQTANDGVTPLFMSSLNGHFPIVEFLVENGADVNQSQNDGYTPLFMGSVTGHVSIVEFLVQNGANVNQAANNGGTPLGASIHNGHEDVVELLRQHGAE